MIFINALRCSLTFRRVSVGSIGHNDLIRISLRINITFFFLSSTALVFINEIENVHFISFTMHFP